MRPCPPAPPGDAAAVQAALGALVDWGNLLATPDGTEVFTVEDFYKARFLYQLSRAGEAAEAALALFEQRLAAPGALQTAALGDIDAQLGELQQLIAAGGDLPRIHQATRQLFARFEELADQARSFLGSLQRSLDLQAGGLDDFVAYKDHLIDYVDRFLRELTAATSGIVDRLDALDRGGVEAVLIRVADRDLDDQLRRDGEARAAMQTRWQRRWEGLRAWFLGAPGRPAQASLLRARTRAAIPALLQALEHLHDRRLHRSDRVADLRCLARWFATAPADDDCHALFRAAFLLAPTRHLAIDAETLDAREQAGITADTSWLDDEPLRIVPRLRRTGRLRSGPGKPAVVMDHALTKLRLRAGLQAEAEALRAARSRIASGEARSLGDFRDLDRRSFQILLDCLGGVLAQAGLGRGPVRCSSGDGSLEIEAEALPAAEPIVVTTADGTFSGPDLRLTIRETWGG